MQNIKLRMTTRQFVPSGNEFLPDDIQFYTEGKSENKDGFIRYTYNDADEYGFTGEITELDISDKDVVMRKKMMDKESTYMTFRPGEKHKGLYRTSFGDIPIEILTKHIDKNLDEQGKGDLGIDYEISFDNVTENRNVLQIRIE